jgi:FMN phosphatase YigB (HAD superfamily)
MDKQAKHVVIAAGRADLAVVFALRWSFTQAGFLDELERKLKGTSDVGGQKPDPEIFMLALDRIHGALATTVFIGNDWIADIAGARAVGLRAVYVDDRATEGLRMATRMADVIEVASTLEDIAAALRIGGWRKSTGRATAKNSASP